MSIIRSDSVSYWPGVWLALTKPGFAAVRPASLFAFAYFKETAAIREPMLDSRISGTGHYILRLHENDAATWAVNVRDE